MTKDVEEPCTFLVLQGFYAANCSPLYIFSPPFLTPSVPNENARRLKSDQEEVRRCEIQTSDQDSPRSGLRRGLLTCCFCFDLLASCACVISGVFLDKPSNRNHPQPPAVSPVSIFPVDVSYAPITGSPRSSLVSCFCLLVGCFLS